MYPRIKRVRRGDQVHEYVQLVEGRREGGKVRQRVVATLGRLDELKASGMLDRWAGAFARLDPPPLGAHREVGPLILVTHYLRRLGLVGLIDAAAPMRGRSQLTHGEVIAALVANRLSSPAPLYDVAGWAGAYAVAELCSAPAGLLNDDRLGRALDALAPVVEDVRGRLLMAALDRFDIDASRLHLDLTAVRFAGAYTDSELVAKGWAADRTVGRQVRALLATTPDGVTLYTRPHKGNRAELVGLAAALETLQRLCPPGLVTVIDSAAGHLKTLCAIDRQQLRFVVPLRADNGWAKRFDVDVPGGLDALPALDHLAVRERELPADARTVYRGTLVDYPAVDPKTRSSHAFRVAYVWSSEEARSVAEARERALAKAEAALAKTRNGLGGRYYKTTKQVQARVARVVGPKLEPLLVVSVGRTRATKTKPAKPTLTWRRDHDAIAAAARLDGLYALATNLADPAGPLTAQDVLGVYKDQWVAEQRNRDAKRTTLVRVRPVFLHTDERIEALFAVVGVALLIFGLIEADLRARLPEGNPRLPGLLPEGRAAKPTGRNVLVAFNHLKITYTAGGPVLDRLTPTQRQILALLDIPLPWPEQPEE